jgi:hypothetical protein
LTDKYQDQVLLKSTQDGFEALRHIIKYNPELVIIEADLPNLNATDIIKCINKKGRSTIFFVITPDLSTKLPCVSDLKKVKHIPCLTQVVKITWNENDFSPILSLIDKAGLNKLIMPY